MYVLIRDGQATKPAPGLNQEYSEGEVTMATTFLPGHWFIDSYAGHY